MFQFRMLCREHCFLTFESSLKKRKPKLGRPSFHSKGMLEVSSQPRAHSTRLLFVRLAQGRLAVLHRPQRTFDWIREKAPGRFSTQNVNLWNEFYIQGICTGKMPTGKLHSFSCRGTGETYPFANRRQHRDARPVPLDNKIQCSCPHWAIRIVFLAR